MQYSKILLYTIIFFSFSGSAFSQSNLLYGTLQNSNKEALAGVLVYIPGTRHSVISDENGSFRIESIKAEKVQVHFSLLGYKEHEKQVRFENKTEINLGSITLQESATALNEVVVESSSTTSDIKKQSYAVAAIDLKKLYNSSKDVNQVLNQVPGIRIREEGGLGSSFNFSLNGFSNKQVKFFIDGIPMDYFGSSMSLNNIPVNIIDRVEVYKGVVPAQFGSDALAGAINIVTNKASKKFADVSYSFGSFNTHRASFNGRYVDHKTGLLLGASAFYNYSDNNYKVQVEIPDAGGKVNGDTTVRRFHDAYQSHSVHLEAGLIEKSFADRLILGFDYSGSHKELQHGYIMKQVFGQVYRTNEVYMPSLKYSKKNFLIKGLSLNAYISYNTGNALNADTSSRSYKWTGEYTVKSDPNPGEADWTKKKFSFHDRSLLVNANMAYDINADQSVSLSYNHTNFRRVGDDPLAVFPIPFKEPNTIDKDILGLSYKIDFMKGRWSNTVFSKLFVMNAETYDASYGSYEAKSMSTDKSGYGIASSFFIFPKFQVKASYENTYRLPDGDELFGDGLLIENNPDLVPESSNNINIGAIYKFELISNRFQVEVNSFYRNAKNFIRQEATGLSSKYINDEKVKSMGLEGEIQYLWKEKLRVAVNATYQDITNNNKYIRYSGTVLENPLYGDKLPNIPYLFGNFDIGYRFANLFFDKSILSVNYSCGFVQHFYLFAPSLGTAKDKYDIPAQWVQNAGLTYSINDGRYNISAECVNLADVRLFDNYKLQKPGRSFSCKLRYYIQ